MNSEINSSAPANMESTEINRKRKAEDSITIPPEQIYFHGPYRPQDWSFRDTIINYITKNPSTSKCYQKLIQTCKYFFIKNPIIVMEKLSSNNKQEVTPLSMLLTKIYLANKMSKFWLTFDLYCSGSKGFPSNFPFHYIYRYDITRLIIEFHNVLFHQFVFLCSNVEHIELHHTIIKNNDGLIVPLEKLIAALPKVKRVHLSGATAASCITANTVTELLKIPHFSRIDLLKLTEIPESFDIDTFFTYIKKNKHTNICLCFLNPISEACNKRLNEIVNEINRTQNCDYKLPFIKGLGGCYKNN